MQAKRSHGRGRKKDGYTGMRRSVEHQQYSIMMMMMMMMIKARNGEKQRVVGMRYGREIVIDGRGVKKVTVARVRRYEKIFWI